MARYLRHPGGKVNTLPVKTAVNNPRRLGGLPAHSGMPKGTPKTKAKTMPTKRRLSPEAMLQAFGERLTRACEVSGISSRAALGRLVGVNEDTAGNWLRGRNYPKPSELLIVIELTGVTSDWLLFGEVRGLTVEAHRRLTRS